MKREWEGHEGVGKREEHGRGGESGRATVLCFSLNTSQTVSFLFQHEVRIFR